jgi:diguanylate cyclase (GGDEF)-like protein
MDKVDIIDNEKSDATILIIDDKVANLKVLATLLQKQGYQVKKAIDGESALIAIENSLPNLILLDIKMPDMDGYEVCRIIKNNPKTQEIPVIFISALNEVFDKIKAFEVGGIDYITKPFHEEEVLARIKSQLIIQKQQNLLKNKQELLEQQQLNLKKEIQRRKETESILYQSRALIASILNSSPDGIAALEAVRDKKTGTIVDFSCIVINPVIARAFNQEPDDLTGKLVMKMFLNKFDDNLFSDFVDVVETGKNLERDIHINNQQEQVWYHVIVVKLGDGVSITARDITDRKNLEFELNKLANLDGLTGISNRRSFDKTLAQEWQHCQEKKQPLSLVLADIDYFKQYNDQYGHLVGDDCLKQVAQIINNLVRKSVDLVARYGGEEFGIILPNVDQEEAEVIVKSIQQGISLAAIPHEQSTTSPIVSLCLGVVSLIPTAKHEPKDLINLADKALYEAKNKGRNCYVISTELV